MATNAPFGSDEANALYLLGEIRADVRTLITRETSNHERINGLEKKALVGTGILAALAVMSHKFEWLKGVLPWV